MWGSILKILADKAAQGVDVRVAVRRDAGDLHPAVGLSPAAGKAGHPLQGLAPIQPFLSTTITTGITGKSWSSTARWPSPAALNLADEYINRKERFGHWKDTAILLRGEAVQSFTQMFLQMWNLTEKEPRWDEALLPSPPVEAEGYVMPYCDCPLTIIRWERVSIWTFSTGLRTMYIS